MHRLDLETSGVLLLAKDKASATSLQKEFEGRRVQKTYLAVCAVMEDRLHKSVDEDEDDALNDFDGGGEVRVVNAAIGDPAEPGALGGGQDDGGRCIRAVTPDGKPASTEYPVLSLRVGDPGDDPEDGGGGGGGGGKNGKRAWGAALVLARPLTGRTHQVGRSSHLVQFIHSFVHSFVRVFARVTAPQLRCAKGVAKKNIACV